MVLNYDNDETKQAIERCYRTYKTTINPIIDWTDDEVWEFIREYNIPYCELYDQGYKRLGCLGCPMNTRAAQELERYPKYKNAYLRAFRKMLLYVAKNNRLTAFRTPEEVYDWWLELKKWEPDEHEKRTLTASEIEALKNWEIKE